MLYVGVDWAEAQHAACLLDAAGVVVRRLTIPQRRAGLARLRAAIAAAEPEPAAVLVAIERPDGLLVERLLDADVRVIAVHPHQVAAMRPRFSAAGDKSDSFDAFVLAELARTRTASVSLSPIGTLAPAPRRT